MSLYTQQIERLLRQAEEMIHRGQHVEGEACARQVLTRQPRNSRASYLLAVSAHGQASYEAALEHIQSALRNDRVNPGYHYVAALCLASLQREGEAILSYQRALHAKPEFFEARANLGYLLERTGDLEGAAACHRKVLAQRPTEWFCLNRLGRCERELGHQDLALDLLERAISIRPEVAESHYELALCLLKAGRKDDAVEHLEKATQFDPKLLEAWRCLAREIYLAYLHHAPRDEQEYAEEMVRRRAQLLECFDRILEQEPGNVEVSYTRDCILGRSVGPPAGFVELFFDRFAPQFDQRLVVELDYDLPATAERLMRPWLASHQGIRAIDLGCGTGLSGVILRQAASHLTGVDLSQGMLDRARARGIYDELAHGEVASYLAGRPAASYELGVSLDVLIYMGDIGAFMGACARAIASGGWLVVSIEWLQGADRDYAVLPSGRYAHAAEYVLSVAGRAGLTLALREEVVLRKEAGQPVLGLLLAFEKD